MNFKNPDSDIIRQLLGRTHTIAVVGLSPKPGRPSHDVAQAMQRFGYRIIPVRPAVTTVLGETAYPSLQDIPFPVDLVNVFRASEHIPEVVESCLAIRAPAIWIQEGIRHEEAAGIALAAGLTVVMDRCIYRDYMALMAG